MAEDYREIAETETDEGAPPTQDLFKALAKNPVAIAEGADDAPRIVDAALDTTATNDGRDWVVSRYLLAGIGAVGTYALMTDTSASTATRNPGYTQSASILLYCNVVGTQDVFNTPSGTWMLCGYIASGSSNRIGIWKRIA